MLGFPLRGALAPGIMRDASLDSTTVSARSGNICEDAQPICCTDRDRDISENVLNDANSLNYLGQAPGQGSDVTMAELHNMNVPNDQTDLRSMNVETENMGTLRWGNQ